MANSQDRGALRNGVCFGSLIADTVQLTMIVSLAHAVEGMYAGMFLFMLCFHNVTYL